LSPILVRPVREQLEHDRIIRLLQAKFRRRYEAAINPGNEQNAAVGTGPTALYPDLVLMSLERGHKLQVVIEVETGESVNHLEALAEWAPFGKLRAAFHLGLALQRERDGHAVGDRFAVSERIHVVLLPFVHRSPPKWDAARTDTNSGRPLRLARSSSVFACAALKPRATASRSDDNAASVRPARACTMARR